MKNVTLTQSIAYAYFFITIIATLVMVYLRLVGDIKLSWWWITAPVWGNLILGVIIVLIIMRLGANAIAKHEK